MRASEVILAIIVSDVIVACGVLPERHLANVAESGEYAAELAECRRLGREAKVDGGAAAYVAAYEQCSEKADLKHGVTFADAGAK